MIQNLPHFLLFTGKTLIDLTPSSLVPHQEIQETFWRGKVINAVGQFVQFEMTQSEEQMESIDNSEVPLVLHAIHLKVTPVAYKHFKHK